MFRISSGIGKLQKHKKLFQIVINNNRSQSTKSSSSGSAVKYGGIVLLGTAAGGAGILGVAAYSDESRKNIEVLIPGSSYLIEAVLGPKIQHIPKTLPEKPDEGLLKKKLEREKAKQTTTHSNDKEEISQDAKDKTISKTSSSSSKVEVSRESKSEEEKIPAVATTKEPEEIIIDAVKTEDKKAIPNEDSSLSDALDVTIEAAHKQVTSALTAAQEAAAAVRDHAEKVCAAIDTEETNEDLFAAAAKIGQVKKDLVNSAKEQLNIAKERISMLQKQIEATKESKFTSDNNTLPAAETALSELQYATNKISTTIEEALNFNEIINEYKSLTDKSFQDFYDEIRAIVPEAKLGDAVNQLCREELFLLLIHAHRKVTYLQKSMARLVTVEQEKLKDMLANHNKVVEVKYTDGKLQTELENQRRELGLEHRHRLTQLKEEMEDELRTQLKRQTAAHSEHLADVIKAKEQELNNKWENKMLDGIQNERDSYIKSMATVSAQVNGIKGALKERADIDKAAHAAQKLWMACESLKAALRLGNANASTWEEKLIPLEEQVKLVQSVLGADDEFVQVVLDSIPEMALKRGVFSEDALRERFLNVDKVCRRVALIGDDGGSLIRYFLSYLQSIFLINASDKIPIEELKDGVVNVEDLDTHNILARVRYCLAKDDLMQAVKYMNLLSGEPRHVSKDWISEVRIYLEAKQAADALMAYAISIGAQAL